jgi:hypothetical protein
MNEKTRIAELEEELARLKRQQKLGEPELRYLISDLLLKAADEFCNHGCTDYSLLNTDENWRIIHAIHQEDGEKRLRPDKDLLWIDDWRLMRYLARVVGR